MTGAGILYLKEQIPQIATLFTTHATATGRAIAGNHLPLYAQLEEYKGDLCAHNFNIVSKHSLEKLSAINCDCFTTVSEITARECKFLLEKTADVITPNGFDISWVPDRKELPVKKNNARKKLISVFRALLKQEISENDFLIASSGRYEFRNKGLDVFLKSLALLNKEDALKRKIIAFFLIPAAHSGPREEIISGENQNGFSKFEQAILTHKLLNSDTDQILKLSQELGLVNDSNSNVRIVFVPVYLNGNDGIFNMNYYELLMGFDQTVFASYYEPWGYTPQESIAFGIPTITTTLSGYGAWYNSNFSENEKPVYVLERGEGEEESFVASLAERIKENMLKSQEEINSTREAAFNVSKATQWKILISQYKQAFSLALDKVNKRIEHVKQIRKPEFHNSSRNDVGHLINKPQWKRMLVKSQLPAELEILKKLANNLWWSWDYEANLLFESIDKETWERYHHNPIALLEDLPFSKYKELLDNENFLTKLNKVSIRFEKYMSDKKNQLGPKTAYFCMEYGLNSIIRLYSGGLGVLAGDYLKEASDYNLDLTAVGLLYRSGYFKQSFSIHGDQLASYKNQKFSFLPLTPVRDKDGNWIKVTLALPGRNLYAKAWKIDVGRIKLYLLDTDIEENSVTDRMTTHVLYGGNEENRLKQEILLGFGGMRLLRLLKENPEVFHCNEGHSAFIGLERLRELIQDKNLSFSEATEVVRSGNLFTTHTPVEAGHDKFSEDLMRIYFSNFETIFNISWTQFMSLGRIHENDTTEKFSMSCLALRLSSEINAVSKIHEVVTRKIFNPVWDGFDEKELNIGSVTNGVHFATWCSWEWQKLFRKTFSKGFYKNPANKNYWSAIQSVPDSEIWDIRLNLKKQMLEKIKERIRINLTNRHENPQKIINILSTLSESALTVGFARRFATYKRAHLLFNNQERLKSIVNNPTKPVQFIFAGKAHPNDQAGQDIIKHIIALSLQPEFQGKIIFVENYNMEIAAQLVQGVDLWLNTPTRPMEASGTSGMKAAMNGIMNFSVLDGWWDEAYHENNGWCLPKESTYQDHNLQNELDAETLYRIFENEIITEYFERNKSGIPVKWIKRIKNTFNDIPHKFTTRRMIEEYHKRYYESLGNKSEKLKEKQFFRAKKLADWKRKVLLSWESIEVKNMDVYDTFNSPIPLGENFTAKILVDLKDLSPQDISMEVVFIQRDENSGEKKIFFTGELNKNIVSKHEVLYECAIPATKSGVYEYGFRIFPVHPELSHRMDFGLVRWV